MGIGTWGMHRALEGMPWAYALAIPAPCPHHPRAMLKASCGMGGCRPHARTGFAHRARLGQSGRGVRLERVFPGDLTRRAENRACGRCGNARKRPVWPRHAVFAPGLVCWYSRTRDRRSTALYRVPENHSHRRSCPSPSCHTLDPPRAPHPFPILGNSITCGYDLPPAP